MKRLSLVLLTGAVLSGCASTNRVPDAEAAQAAAMQNRSKAAPAEPPRPTLVTIEYGNATSKASFQVDIANNDVYIDMSNARTRTDTVRTPAPAAAQTPAQPQWLTPPPQYSPQQPTGPQEIRHVNVDSSVREDTRRIVDATGRPQAGDSGATLKVTASIRKAQDAFYRGSYEEAQILARKSIETQPTPEAHALAGSIAWTVKDYPLARFHWKQALSLDPEFPGVSDMLARLPAETLR